MKLIVGIDFGTSTTVVRYKEEGTNNIKAIKDADGRSDIIPSVIFRHTANGTTEYGVSALNVAESPVQGTAITNFKMDLLDARKREGAKKLIEEYLKYIYSLFKEQTKHLYPTSTDIYISYPAKWDDSMAQIMKDAVADAGFKGNIKGIKEPEAAIRNILCNHLKDLQRTKLLGTDRPLRILVLDMGAGTTDISLFKVTIDKEGTPHLTEPLTYPSREEVILCGGREIDLALQDYLIRYCKEKGFEIIPDAVDLINVKRWKETAVSNNLKQEKPVPLLPSLALLLKYSGRNDIINAFSIDRKDFESATKDHWEKLYSLIKSAISQYKYADAEDFDFVCLTGGHSVWYTVPKLFNGEGVCDFIAEDGKEDALDFKKLKDDPWRVTAINDTLPHESVARGLCLMDQKIIYETSSSNNVWAKITVNNDEGDIVQVVNKLDDVLPVEKNLSYNTTIQRNHVLGKLGVEMQIDIYEGETLENAEHRVLKMDQAAGNIISRLILALFVFPLFMQLGIDISVGVKMKMTEEGILEIDGEFKLDNNDSYKFTYDDFN